ncbi:MAG TPA: hypothetical protein VHO47_02870 [Candidatus Babeliales bacterium]|nr:hypothetical protein [Candidatus Babeliales bacterium]
MIRILICILFSISITAMEADMDESKRQEYAQIALFQNGFSKEAIEKLSIVNADDIAKVKRLTCGLDTENQIHKNKIYIAELKNGDVIVTDYCEVKQRVTCKRLVQIPLDPKLIIELPLKSSYYELIEKQFKS